MDSAPARHDHRVAAILDALGTTDLPAERALVRMAAAVAEGSATDIPLPAELTDPWLLGQVREALHASDDRAALGAWFTPPGLARHLVAAVQAQAPATVLDPACGGGAFLLAANERWPSARPHGWDLDPVAVEVTRAALTLAGCRHHRIETADGLGTPGRRHDVVLGNPPFLSQLGAGTARDDRRRRMVRQRFGAAAARYVDEVGLFVLAIARDLLAPEGEAVLVVPESLLATADAAAVRAEVTARYQVEMVWRDVERVFPGVPTCAIRLTARPPAACRATTPHAQPLDTPPPTPPPSPPPTPADTDRTAAPLGATPDGWARLLTGDVPAVDLPDDLPTVGTMASATADFRDAYYLLADHVAEADGAPDDAHRLVTVGLIDPAHLRWGHTPARFARRSWDRPVAGGLPPSFTAARLGAKVLVATQTRVLEALVDADGELLPSTPTITVRTDRPWHVAAALTSPVLSAVALHRHAGAARARGAIKLSARQVLALPLPLPGPAWDEAADLVRRAHDTADADRRHRLLRHCGAAMTAAYGRTDPALLRWWVDRLPRR